MSLYENHYRPAISSCDNCDHRVDILCYVDTDYNEDDLPIVEPVVIKLDMLCDAWRLQ